MTGLWRPLALAAVLTVIASAGVADAQTVIVRNAPPGSTIELAFNAATIGSATAGATGEATLTVKNTGATEKDARIYVDVCGKVRRVLLVERYVQPPVPGNGCDRKEIAGFFVMRSITTFVLDVGGASPMVWLRQGPAPEEWLTQTQQEQPVGGSAPRTRRPSPKGLILSGGGGFTKFRDVVTQACGNVSDCSGKNYDLSYTVSAAYWLTRYLAAEGSFVRPSNLTVNGSGNTFHFDNVFDPRIYTIAGKAGAPLGPVRVYGLGGMNYHQATSTTTNTIDDKTVTVDGTTQTIPGGTQTFELKTQGWGWLFGGGIEGWVGRRAGIYAEVARAQIKGNAVSGDGSINDRVTFILFGARVHIGP
jgi:opacity protein-like surface antigen